MVVEKDTYPIGLTPKEIGEIISRAVTTLDTKSATFAVKNLARPLSGDIRAHLKQREAQAGTTRLFSEDQILVALVHVLLREIGKMPRALSESVTKSLGENGNFILGDSYKLDSQKGRQPRVSSAQRAIDFWRSGKSGFSFIVHLYARKTTDESTYYTEYQSGITCEDFQDAGTPNQDLPFNPAEGSLAYIKLPLDRHLALIFGAQPK